MLLVYGATLAPDLAPGHDSAELTTAACLPGVAHPPSYPLYIVVGYLFSHVPLGSPAYRLNLMAAFFSALAVALAYLAFRRLTGNVGASLGASLAFGLAQTPWRQAVGAEKYSLHLAILAALLWLSADWTELDPSRRSRRLGWIGLTLGLGLAHHHTILLAVPGLALLLGCSRPASWKGLGAVGLGLLVYLYTPLRALQHPALNWGDPSSLDRFLWVVTRTGYGTVSLNTDTAAGAGLDQLGHYFHSLLWQQFPVFGLAALGAWKCRRGRLFCACLALDWLLMGPLFALQSGQSADEAHFDLLERFYASSYLVFAGLIAAGWAELVPGRWAWSLTPAALVAGLLHYPACSLRGQYQPADLERTIFDRLPPRAIYLPGSDLCCGGALYTQLILQERRDVQVLFPGLLGSAWYRASLAGPSLPPGIAEGTLPELCAAWRARHQEVYFDAIPTDVPGFFVPEGLVFRYLAPSEPLPDRIVTERANFEFLQPQVRRGDYRRNPDQPYWIHENLGRWASAFRRIAESLAQSDPERAGQALDLAAEMDPQPIKDSQLRALILKR